MCGKQLSPSFHFPLVHLGLQLLANSQHCFSVISASDFLLLIFSVIICVIIFIISLYFRYLTVMIFLLFWYFVDQFIKQLFFHGGEVFYSLLVTRFFLLVTRYFYSLLVTFYSLFIASYSLLVTFYLLLVTCYLLLFTRYSLLLTFSLLLLTRDSRGFIRKALHYVHNVHMKLYVSSWKSK